MEEKIEIDTLKLKWDREEIEKRTGQIKSEVDDLFELVDSLNQMWEGSAKENFIQQMKKDYEIMKEIHGELERYIHHIEETQLEYERCENAITELVEAIKIE